MAGFFFARETDMTIRRKMSFFSCFQGLSAHPSTTIDSYSAILQNVALFMK
jgi:hypothetical protein